MSARAAILDRVRASQATARLPAPRTTETPRLVTLAPPERLERFLAELAALGVDAHVVASAADVRARVASLVAGRRVLAWDAAHLPYEVGALVPDAVTGRASRDEQAQAELGLTGCDAAIAETGSLVLFSGPGASRTVSLLPPVHVAVVPRSVLVSNMADVFEARADALANAACCTIVTGPSRTADIELTLTLGVHGPGRVVVVIGP